MTHGSLTKISFHAEQLNLTTFVQWFTKQITLICHSLNRATLTPGVQIFSSASKSAYVILMPDLNQKIQRLWLGYNELIKLCNPDIIFCHGQNLN